MSEELRRAPRWTRVAGAGLVVIFALLLVRSIATYAWGRHQLDLLEAVVPVGTPLTEAYDHVRVLGYTAYGISQADEDANGVVFETPWQRGYNAAVKWPTYDTNSHLLFALIYVPIGGVICQKRAILMLEYAPPGDTITKVEEVGPAQRCVLPVLQVHG